MLLTEDEAKTKWCPFARLGEIGATYNRTGPVAGLQCIASDCAAWRDVPRERHLHDKRTGARISSALSENSEWRLANPDEPSPASRGYCGLAGRPS